MGQNERFPRLVVSGTQSGVGKTTVVMGLLAALKKRMSIQPFKIGPDYIDTAYHSFITGRKARNLDGWLMEEQALIYLFRKNMTGAELALIEGVMGLFDGLEIGSDLGSTAQVAKILQAPVILVMDGSGMSGSAAAQARGYACFDSDLSVAGIIFNRVNGEGHYRLLREAVESVGLKVYGYLPLRPDLELPSRHLGLVPSGEIPALQEKIARLAEVVEKTVDLDGLTKLAMTWPQKTPLSSLQPFEDRLGDNKREVRIGVALDKAFNFYYWDNLDLLAAGGARLEFFSPLEDDRLPSGLDGIILGGGFPEVFAGALQENHRMRESIRKALSAGLHYYAECGGYMYLLQELEDMSGQTYKMTGWIEGRSKMTGRLQKFGYAHLVLKGPCIWGEAGDSIRVHNFHHSRILGVHAPAAYSLTKRRRGVITDHWECGLRKGQGVAGYPHLHFYSNLKFAENFLSSIREVGACRPKG